MANDRMDKIDELVKREVAVILQMLFPDYIITVTQVKVSKDLSFSKIWISSNGDDIELLKLCKLEAKEIRQKLAKNVVLRRVPYIQFVLDQTEKEADKIERLISDIKKEEQG